MKPTRPPLSRSNSSGSSHPPTTAPRINIKSNYIANTPRCAQRDAAELSESVRTHSLCNLLAFIYPLYACPINGRASRLMSGSSSPTWTWTPAFVFVLHCALWLYLKLCTIWIQLSFLPFFFCWLYSRACELPLSSSRESWLGSPRPLRWQSPRSVLVLVHYEFFIISCVFIGRLFGWLCLGRLVRVFLAPVGIFSSFFYLFMCCRLRAFVNSLGQYHCKCFYWTVGTIWCQSEAEHCRCLNVY